MDGLLIQILITVLIFVVLFWAVSRLPLPSPWNQVAYVVLVVVFLIWLIRLLGGLTAVW